MKLSKVQSSYCKPLLAAAAASAQGSEFTRTFLLETGRYEVSAD